MATEQLGCPRGAGAVSVFLAGAAHSGFLREFPVWLLSDAVLDLKLATGRKLWQPIKITIIKVKLNPSVSSWCWHLLKDRQEVSMPTLVLCLAGSGVQIV